MQNWDEMTTQNKPSAIQTIFSWISFGIEEIQLSFSSYHKSNSIVEELICFLSCFRSHRLRLKGIIYLPARLIFCQITLLMQMLCLFFSGLLFSSGNTLKQRALFFINAVCLLSAANNRPFANPMWVFPALILCTVSIYCPFVAGGSVCICTHAWAAQAHSIVGVCERIMIGATGGAACHLQQQLIRKEKKVDSSSQSRAREAGGMKQPSSPLTLLNILIYTISRDRTSSSIHFL